MTEAEQAELDREERAHFARIEALKCGTPDPAGDVRGREREAGRIDLERQFFELLDPKRRNDLADHLADMELRLREIERANERREHYKDEEPGRDA